MIYQFMFDPKWEEGCPSCSHLVDNIGNLAHLHSRNTTLALVSRAPIAKIAPFQKRMGWTIPWYSSFGSDFNYDFHTTTDESAALVEYNYQDVETLRKKGETYHIKGEQPGISAFLCDGDKVFHTYSVYGRGLDSLIGTYNWLDLTAFGRQEEFEESPAGWPRVSEKGWRLHDKYESS